MTLEKAIEVLRKEIDCENLDQNACSKIAACCDCPFHNDPDERIEAYRIILKEYERGMRDSETEGGD